MSINTILSDSNKLVCQAPPVSALATLPASASRIPPFTDSISTSLTEIPPVATRIHQLFSSTNQDIQAFPEEQAVSSASGICKEHTMCLKSTEDVYHISPTEAILYDRYTHRMRIIQVIQDSSPYPSVQEFIFPSQKFSCYQGMVIMVDAEYVWNKLHGERPIKIQLKIELVDSECLCESLQKKMYQAALNINGKDDKGYPALFPFFSRWTEDQLVEQIANLQKLIPVDSWTDHASGKKTLSIRRFKINNHLTTFLLGIQTIEDPEMALERILKKTSENDKWILYKYLSGPQMGSIGKMAFKKVAQHIQPDLSKIENLSPIFDYPLDPEEWKHIFPLLERFSTKDEGAIKSFASTRNALEIEQVILKALVNAVEDKNPEAICFLVSHFPFLKSRHIAEIKFSSISFVDSSGIEHSYSFGNPFYAAITSGDVRLVEAFLAGGWNLKKKAGDKIIQTLLEEEYDVPTRKFRPFTDKELKNKKAIFLLLLKYGLDPELIITGSSGMHATLGETLFLHNAPEVKKMGLYLFEKGAALTPRTVEQMKLELRHAPVYQETLIKVLIEQGKASDEEIRCLQALPAAIGSRDSLIVAISMAKGKVHTLFRRYIGNPLIQDFTEIEQIRALKKEAKTYLAEHSEDLCLTDLYQSFSSEYDALVTNHYLLCNLRQISQQLRSFVNSQVTPEAQTATFAKPYLSDRVVTLFSLWHPVAGVVRDQTITFIYNLNTVTRSANFHILRSNLLHSVAQMHADPFWKDKQVSCIHGTKLTPDMIKTRALIPAGMMGDDIEGAIIPFSGEQCGSNIAHNKEHISCTAPGKNWDEVNKTDRLQNVPTPMLIAEVYAKQVYEMEGLETGFDYEESKNRVNSALISETIFTHTTLSNKRIQHLCTDILRLRAWDPSHQDYLTPLLIKVNKALENSTTCKEAKPTLQQLLQALTIKIKYPLTQADKELISHPIPIMFASTTYSPLSQRQAGYAVGNNDEVFIKGRAHLGKDLQAAFVDEEDLPRARALLQPQGVQVFPFHIAHAIETERIIKGANILETTQALITNQSILGAILQQDILPHYGKPLAQAPSYVDATGAEHLIEHPFWGNQFDSYDTYIKAVDETLAVPRFIHGKMHAVRTAIGAQLWANVYSAMKQETVAPDRKLLAIAAAAHDAQRQDEGIDHWDLASGLALRSYLASRNHPKEICDLYAQALIEKDPTINDATAKPIFTSYEQCAIHDADVIEIMRVLHDRTAFQTSRLAGYAVWEECKQLALAKVPADDKADLTMTKQRISQMETDLEQLVVEWGDFIAMTEKLEIKLLLEYTPAIDYYTEVMKILKYVSHDSLPTLKKFLEAELAEITGDPLKEVLPLLPLVRSKIDI